MSRVSANQLTLIDNRLDGQTLADQLGALLADADAACIHVAYLRQGCANSLSILQLFKLG